jgi:hypothetical protein
MFSAKSFSTKTFSTKTFKFWGISPAPKKPTGGGGSWLDQERTRQEIIDIQDKEAIFVISVAVAALNKLK